MSDLSALRGRARAAKLGTIPAVQDGSQDRLAALGEAFRAFAEVTTDYRGLLETVACRVAALIGDACVVSLACDDDIGLAPSAACGHDDATTALLRDALAHPAEPAFAFASALHALGIRSSLSVPLAARGRRLGALAVYRYLPTSAPYAEPDRTFARSIGDHAALALSNAQLFESLQVELAQRKKAEDKAKTFVALIENSNDMIAMAELGGRVLFINAAGRALCGLAPDQEALDLTLADFHTEDGLRRGEIIRETGSWRGEGVLRHFGTGELIPTRISSFLVRDSDGCALGYATVQHDLRETKRLESELRQAQKMEALGRLAGGVAHDFNNLLTVILSYCAMLAKRLPADGRSAQDVAQIERAGLRAAELTHQLLAFSRRQVLEPAPLDLGAALRGMDDMLRRLIGEDIELRILAGTDVGAVMVDAGQVEQVVMNLVVNARDAMPTGGVLTLETTHVDVTPAVGARLGVRPGAYNTLAVGDTGAGIDEATKSHLFEPFFTTKEQGKGTGLGLSTVMGIVEQSGGHITVESSLGAGSTFRIYLPVTPRATTVVATAATRPVAEPRRTQRILVVEDEEGVRVLVREVLSQAGYEVHAAVDGEHALEVAAAVHGEIHLLLTDVIMPRMSGRQLAARFVALRPTTRVLYMSGYTDDKLGQHGLLDADVELIQKPLTPALLLRRVRERLA